MTDLTGDYVKNSETKYRKQVLRTALIENTNSRDALLMGAMGLAGETGEVVDALKKQIFHGKLQDRLTLLNELGDVRWYLEYLLIALDSSIEEIEKLNIEKLLARYPNISNLNILNLKGVTK